MGHSVAPGSSRKDVIASWVGVGGGWKRVLGRWVGIGGAWKQYFEAGIVSLLPATVRGFANDPDVPIARIDFSNSGIVTGTYTDHTVSASSQIGKWYDPSGVGVGSGFQIRAHKVAGEATVTGASVGSWLSLSSNRFWQIAGGGALNSGSSASLMVDIRASGSSEILASAIYLLSTVTYSSSYPSGFEGREGGINKPVPHRWAEY